MSIKTLFTDIATAIKEKNTDVVTITPGNMPQAIRDIETGADIFAFIRVEYSPGAICTATNGALTLIAEDTSGFYPFAIPTPSNLPETWTVTAVLNGETATKTVIISAFGDSPTVNIVFDSIARLKQDVNSTEYMYLSNTTGDGASSHGRGFTRTTGEPPVFFIDAYISAGFYGYGVISLQDTFSGYDVSSSYGRLDYAGTLATLKGTQFYIFQMAGMWPDYYPTYTVDGQTFDRGDRRSYAYITDNPVRVTGDKVNEVYSFIDRLYALQSEVAI